MRKFGGAMLAGVATAAIASADPLLCSMSDGSGEGEGAGAGGGSGFGGAAAFLEGDGGEGAGGAAAAGEGAGAGDGGAAAGAAAGAEGAGAGASVADWMKTFSGEKAGEDPSNQEWLAKKGFTDPDAVVKSYREAEKALRESGKVKIPGEGASEAEISAYREAIGAPKDAAGYAIEVPAEAKEYEIDTAVLEPLQAVAHKHNLPAAAFKELGDVFMQGMLEEAKAEVHRTTTEANDWLKDQPDQTRAKEEFRRGATFLGLTAADVQNIQREYGGGKTMELFGKIGKALGEDFFAGNNNAATRFGVSSAADAQAQIDAMIADPDTAAKLNSKEPTTVAKWNRLSEAQAMFRQQESQRGRR